MMVLLGFLSYFTNWMELTNEDKARITAGVVTFIILKNLSIIDLDFDEFQEKAENADTVRWVSRFNMVIMLMKETAGTMTQLEKRG